MVSEFNRGIYDYIIATDEGASPGVGEGPGGSKPASRKRKRDKEYGVARGIDFQGKFPDIFLCETLYHVCAYYYHVQNPLPH